MVLEFIDDDIEYVEVELELELEFENEKEVEELMLIGDMLRKVSSGMMVVIFGGGDDEFSSSEELDFDDGVSDWINLFVVLGIEMNIIVLESEVGMLVEEKRKGV